MNVIGVADPVSQRGRRNCRLRNMIEWLRDSRNEAEPLERFPRALAPCGGDCRVGRTLPRGGPSKRFTRALNAVVEPGVLSHTTLARAVRPAPSSAPRPARATSLDSRRGAAQAAPAGRSDRPMRCARAKR